MAEGEWANGLCGQRNMKFRHLVANLFAVARTYRLESGLVRPRVAKEQVNLCPHRAHKCAF